MGITDEISDLEDSLKGVDKLLVQSNKDALMLKTSLSGINTFVGGKNYEIISRFLSGTGAWKVLNKAKATVLTMIQLVSVQERAALQDNIRMKEMAKIIKERKELIKLESQFKKASLNQDKELIEKLKEKSDVFAAQAILVGDDKAMKEILKRIKKSKGLLSKILGKGKVSGKTLTEDPMNKNILDSNLIQTAAIVAGTVVNRKFLKSIMGNTQVTSQMLKSRKDQIAALTVDFQEVWNNMPQETLEGKPVDYDKELLKFVNEMSDMHITSLTPKLEDIQNELGLVADNLGKYSLNPKKLMEQGMEYINNIADLGAADYKNRMDTLEANKKIRGAAEEYVAELYRSNNFEQLQKIDPIGTRTQLVNAGEMAIGGQMPESTLPPELVALIDTATALEKALFDRRNERSESRLERQKAAFGRTDEQKEKWSETLMNRRKLFKRIYEKPLLKIREGIENNGGITGAIGEWMEEGGTKIVEFTGKILSFTKKAFIYLGLMLLALFVLYRVFKSAGVREELTKIWEYTRNFYTNYLVPPLMMMWAGIEQIIKGFQEGKFYLVILGLLQIFGGLIIFSLQLMRLGITIALKLLWQSLVGIYDWLFASGQGLKKTASKIGYITSAILFLVAFFMGGWVLALAGAVVLGLSMALEHLSFFAGGGTTTGGLSVVGEKGPELVKLPVGSRVHSNVDSRKMLSSGHTTNNITVQVTGRVGASDSEIKDIANKLSRELNNRMNRTGSAVSGF
tara:strand:- start:201 stop:2420 length:2220 start_codon:yes stop_codon:yes gene_type:complete